MTGDVMTRRATIVSLCFGAGVLNLMGCVSGGAQLVRDNDSGGVVTYLYKEDRGVEIMKLKCPHGYIVVKEGEAKGLSGVSSVEGTEDEPSRRWAFQFRCKP